MQLKISIKKIESDFALDNAIQDQINDIILCPPRTHKTLSEHIFDSTHTKIITCNAL